ncbi:MAG: hypothetical protein V2A54_01660 [Bacteroidota bacterium]
MKKIFLFLSAFILIFSFNSCYYDNETDLYPNIPGSDTTNSCDTVGLTYNTDLLPFFNSKCNGCHNSYTPILTNYAQTQSYVATNGMKLFDYVKDGNHQSVTLTDCEKSKLKAWINAGIPQ